MHWPTTRDRYEDCAKQSTSQARVWVRCHKHECGIISSVHVFVVAIMESGAFSLSAC